ncbi:ATP-binding protein (plasmid) [Burkholderia vietnamiensis]|uniref:BbrUII/HgiDII family restriction enzyme n=1 Tax=Burkholderia vietnamiensis TaxID=60552 RepID=UPI002018F3CE|nr:ATP-binding protein [Burkholderia vietnamiensis]MCO1349983.1 ATP-binding protein [Burkholderia vietnamiensis]MCO1432453.1 ATP-binding protein [Burkholderia vietnamiensis]UQN47386.1 ATP-binding protein [Burkholderia vietnamiensis]
MSDAEHPYHMTIDLRILNHLGIHLYSNVAAVLSEAVANAWDADATEVRISIADDKIEIQDSGSGMDQADINDRYLNVGYSKREREGDKSPNGRDLMGRKGIGKLSLFSVADVVDVYTSKDGNTNCFRMTVAGIEDAIKQRAKYHPTPLQCGEEIKPGTRIVLTALKKKRTARTADALRKRIARRFSVIGYSKFIEKTGVLDKFDVYINNVKVTPADREDLRRLEFLWEFGDAEKISSDDLPALKRRSVLSAEVAGRPEWRVQGWIGAVPEPKQLTTDDSGALNNIVVLSRGRLIQENVLDKINYSRIFTKYITGQIEADFLDLTDHEDIATSDRQRLLEDDERYQALIAFVRTTLLSIDDVWTRWRNDARAKDAVSDFPELEEWVKDLPEGQREPARQMLGMIRGVDVDTEEQRADLYKAGVLAFERLRLKESAHKLSESGVLTAAALLPLLSDLSMLEGSLYRDIVESRLDVIRKFEGLVDTNEKEKVLQEHLFQNLWLLDPGWDRAAGSQRIEQTLKQEYAEFADGLTDEQSKGRYDIKYRSNGGLHILVELKRADRKMHVYELSQQGQKYKSALHQCLVKAGEANPQIAIVFVLGQPTHEDEDMTLGRNYVERMLEPLNARVVYYEELIQSANAGYAEFLEESEKADKVARVVSRLTGKKPDALVGPATLAATAV